MNFKCQYEFGYDYLLEFFMWNIAIIENEEAMSNQLVSYFAKFGKENNESYSFAIFNNAETFLKNYKKRLLHHFNGY